MKKITTVLFDLDGTLLPMDQDTFIKAYLGGLVKVAAPYGYEPALLAKSIMTGTYCMYKNDGQKSNEDVFWAYMQSVYGDKIMADGIKSYLKSGETVFVAVGLAHVIGENGIVDQLREAGYTVTRVE